MFESWLLGGFGATITCVAAAWTFRAQKEHTQGKLLESQISYIAGTVLGVLGVGFFLISSILRGA